MRKSYSLNTTAARRRAAAWLPAGLLVLAGLGACQNETEVLPDQRAEYYPLEVGAYRIYDVVDSSFQANVPTVSRFQFREQVDTELPPDATGEPVYRIIRSRRSSAAQPWQADSIITVRVSARHVVEQRNNRKTVELVFPAQADKFWNANAFNGLDTIVAQTRQYQFVEQPFSVTSNGKTYAYPTTLATINNLDDAETGINLFYYTALRSVYAKGVGPVYRARRRFIYCPPGNCIPNANYIFQGQSRSEVLVESDK